eukprot:6184836-Pleurochrysis_carterae.AAC.3
MDVLAVRAECAAKDAYASCIECFLEAVNIRCALLASARGKPHGCGRDPCSYQCQGLGGSGRCPACVGKSCGCQRGKG